MTAPQDTPLFSILLPTRNRLGLAKGMIATLLGQTCQDWELIVADNASEEDVGGYLAGLRDPRIRWLRSDEALPVTDNWNRAIDAARGRLVVMMGDDDGLVPGALARIAALARDFPDAEAIYCGAWHFAFPGAIAVYPDGALTDVTRLQLPLRGRHTPEPLPREEARALALAALAMRCDYAFNMQHFVFTSRLLGRIRAHGAVFQGPFPDFYAANLALLLAASVLAVPEPLVIIGISRKSYGHHHFRGDEAAGAAFLGIGAMLAGPEAGLAGALLPGSTMNSAWLLSVARVGAHLDLPVDVARYRRLQVLGLLLADDPRALHAALRPHLFGRERLLADLLLGLRRVTRALLWGRGRGLMGRLHTELARQYPPPPDPPPQPRIGGIADMPALFRFLAAA